MFTGKPRIGISSSNLRVEDGDRNLETDARRTRDGRHMDIESLERQNDASISALEEKTALLRGITSGIHAEVRQQNNVLEELKRGMQGVRVGLGGTVVKIKRVMEGPRGSQYMYGMVGGVVLLLLFTKYVL